MWWGRGKEEIARIDVVGVVVVVRGGELLNLGTVGIIVGIMFHTYIAEHMWKLGIWNWKRYTENKIKVIPSTYIDSYIYFTIFKCVHDVRCFFFFFLASKKKKEREKKLYRVNYL